MDMLEDYLRAVSRLLPRLKRDDIVAELRDEILTRIEARESELGRSLNDIETEQLLRDFGHPIVVAARYREGPQSAIGAAFYPYWMFAVRMIVLIEVCASVFVFLARVISGVNVAEAFGQAIGSGLTGTMTLIGFATVAAWLIERKSINIDYLNNWRVRDLRFLDFAFWDWADINEWVDKMNTSKTGGYGRTSNPTADSYYGFNIDRIGHGWTLRQSSAGRAVAIIVAGTVFVLWWTGLLRFGLTPLTLDYQAMNIDAGALANVDFAALKAAVYWPILAYFAAVIGFGFVVLLNPRGVRMRGVLDIAIGLSGMALAAWVWTASPLADIVRVTSVQSVIERIAAFFAHPVPVPLELLATLMVIGMAFGGFCRVIGGLWETLSGAPRYAHDE